MMCIKKIVLLNMVCLSIFTTSMAIAASPTTCPAVATIAATAAKDYFLKQAANSWHIYVERNKFATNECWAFNTGDFSAKNKEDALIKAKKILASLSLVRGPIEIASKKFQCEYKSDATYAFAVTPTFYECY